MIRKVSELKGAKSLKALNAFHALLLGLKMLPMSKDLAYEEFFESFKEKSDDEKEKALRLAASFVELSAEEVNALIGFCSDKNGIPYSNVNANNLSLEELHEIIVSVCMEIGRIKIDLVSDDEKKKLKILA